MEYRSKMSLLLLSMSCLLFVSSCEEETPQKTTAKDSQPEPIVKRDTSWTDGKITRLSSSKREDSITVVELIEYTPDGDSSSTTIVRTIDKFMPSGQIISTNAEYYTVAIAIDSFRGLDLFDENNTPTQKYHLVKIKRGHTISLAVRSNRKGDREFSFDPKVIPVIVEKELNKKLDNMSVHTTRKSFFHMNGDCFFSYEISDISTYKLADSIEKKIEPLPEQFIMSYYKEY
ncbi:hypothetical protein PPO43_09495 [Saprospira sp. CCB-QB6]|uniref:hypothetical protein n=1 Tax=Saprospira sp. CCB-QB6 TaxID=3023936 RepID=UPI002349D545|nr:hypothetical protein [Saprospira sp. CCB-QB6]WCL80209.1 hypothetical protein PPO43_09495 [Saprospira sp. CCB-QB6]